MRRISWWTNSDYTSILSVSQQSQSAKLAYTHIEYVFGETETELITIQNVRVPWANVRQWAP